MNLQHVIPSKSETILATLMAHDAIEVRKRARHRDRTNRFGAEMPGKSKSTQSAVEKRRIEILAFIAENPGCVFLEIENAIAFTNHRDLRKLTEDGKIVAERTTYSGKPFRFTLAKQGSK